MRDSDADKRAQVNRHAFDNRIKSEARLVSDQSGLNRLIAGAARVIDKGRRDLDRNRSKREDAVRLEHEKGRREHADGQRRDDRNRSETLERFKLPPRS